MLPELSLHVLDIAENSVRAGASKVEILVSADLAKDLLTIRIADDGKGMSEEEVRRVTDPFFTTRTTRRIGLGIPFFRQACELSGGALKITSAENKGTCVTATFQVSHIDRMPLGDMPSSIHALVTSHEETAFAYRFAVTGDGISEDNGFLLDTDEMHDILGDVPFHAPEVSAYIREYLEDNTKEVLRTAGLEAL